MQQVTASRGRTTTVLAYAASTASAGMTISSAATALASLPAWLAIFGLLAVAVIGLIHRVFPQASADRLTWWQSWWARRRA